MLFLLLAQLAVTPPTPETGDRQGSIGFEDYPPEARKNGWEGKVVMDLTVGTDGQVATCTVTKSSGHKSLDEGTCAIMTARARFKPALDQSGQPVEGHYEQQINWRLEH